jgi:glycosyltransferase involved in cell wall biosynthesis
MNIFVDGIIFSGQRLGGISRIYSEVLPRITRLDPSVTFELYIRRKLKNHGILALSGIAYLKEPSIYPWRWLKGKAWVQDTLLNRTCRKRQPDIFHSTYFTLSRNGRSRTVISIYDMMDEIYAPILQRPSHFQLVERKRRCIQKADLILSISRHTTEDILKYCPTNRDKIVTIHLGVGPEFRTVHDEEEKRRFRVRHGLVRPFFLYVGKRGFIKNFLQLLRAYADFKGNQDIDLITVGGEEEWTQEEQALLSMKKLSGRVKRLPMLPDSQLVLAYNTALAYVYPSLYEGFGLPVLEAMACGTPVLTSNVASLPEVAGDAALYFHPQERDDIKAALEAVLDRETAQRLTEKGKVRAAHFTWDETARKTLQAYRQLV